MLKAMEETLKKQGLHVSHNAAITLKTAFRRLRFSEDAEWLNIRKWHHSGVKHSLNDKRVNTIQMVNKGNDQGALISRCLAVDSHLCATPCKGSDPLSQVRLSIAKMTYVKDIQIEPR